LNLVVSRYNCGFAPWPRASRTHSGPRRIAPRTPGLWYRLLLMRVTQYSPDPVDSLMLGLSNIHFRRLGQVVVLAGPNGAGKTRILRNLRDSLNHLKSQYQSPTSSLEKEIARLRSTSADT